MKSARRVGWILAVMTHACSGSPTSGEDPLASLSEGVVPARAGEEAVIGVGETAHWQSEGLAVTYVRLVGDSRCPMEALCVWEGDAEVLVKVIQSRRATVDVQLHTNGSSGPRRYESAARVVELVRVDPYPSVHVQPDPARSRIALRLVAAGG